MDWARAGRSAVAAMGAGAAGHPRAAGGGGGRAGDWPESRTRCKKLPRSARLGCKEGTELEPVATCEPGHGCRNACSPGRKMMSSYV